MKLHKKKDIIHALKTTTIDDNCPTYVKLGQCENVCALSIPPYYCVVRVAINSNKLKLLTRKIEATKQPHHFRSVVSAHKLIMSIIEDLNHNNKTSQRP